MPDPLTMAAITYGGDKLIGGVSDLIGGSAAAKAKARGEKRAMSSLTGGLAEAKGYQQPIQEAGVGAYTDLAGRYGAGEFDRDEFGFDPEDVFNDPEFQASLRAGTAARDSSAMSKGDLFSTAAGQAQQQFGQDLFSQRSDALFDRAMDTENMGRQSDLTDFNMGMNIAQPGINAAGDLSDLSYRGGRDIADLHMGAGKRKAGDAIRKSNILGDLGKEALGTGVKLLGTGG